MTVFKYFLRIAWRYRSIVLVYGVIFFAMAALNGGSMRESNQSFRNTELTIAVSVPTSTPLAEGFIEYLSANNKVERVDWTEAAMREQVFIGNIDAAIVLPDDVEMMVENGQPQVKTFVTTQNMGAQLLSSTVNQYFIFANAMLKSNGEVDIARLNNVLMSEAEVLNVGQSEGMNSVTQWGSFYFKFLGFILISIFIALLGILLSGFEEKNVALRQKLGALSLAKISREKFMGSALVAGIISFVLILPALVLQPTLWQYASFYEHIGVMLVTGISVLALAYLCATVAGSNQIVYSGLSTVLGVGLSFISGVYVPIEVLNASVVAVAKLFPLYYATVAHDAIFAKEPYLHNIGILALFAITYFILAMTVSRLKQSR